MRPRSGVRPPDLLFETSFSRCRFRPAAITFGGANRPGDWRYTRQRGTPTLHFTLNQHMASSEPLPQHDAALFIHSVDLENVLRDIESNNARWHGSPSPGHRTKHE